MNPHPSTHSTPLPRRYLVSAALAALLLLPLAGPGCGGSLGGTEQREATGPRKTGGASASDGNSANDTSGASDANHASALAKGPPNFEEALTALHRASDINGHLVGAAAASVRGTLVVVFASWCSNCRAELSMLGGFRLEHPDLRIIGLNAYEDYADRGNEAAMRSYVADNAPWMQVVRASSELMAAFGTPQKVPSVFLFDSGGTLVEAFDRGKRAPPGREQLAQLYSSLAN